MVIVVLVELVMLRKYRMKLNFNEVHKKTVEISKEKPDKVSKQ